VEKKKKKEAIEMSPKRDLKPRVEFDKKGRVLIPKWIRNDLGAKEGTIAEIEIWGDDKILITLLRR